MLGPLPPLYRCAVCALALVGCVGTGAWLGTIFSQVAASGAGVGAGLGLVLVALLLLDHSEHDPARVRHRLRHH
jgi:hypothetical protein